MAVRVTPQAAAEHLADLAYLTTCLKADPQTAELAPNVEAASTRLRATSKNWNLHRRAVREMQMGLRRARHALGNVVRTAQFAILADVRHHRSAPSYLTYFPRGPAAFTRSRYVDQLAAITRASYQGQLTTVRSLARRCAQDPSPKVQEQAGLLNAGADQMDAAFGRRGEALVAELASYGQLQVEKLATIDTCRRVGYRLAELYPSEQDRVRSYFRPNYRQARPTAPTAGDPTPVTQAPATGTAVTGAAPAAPAASTLVLTPSTASV
jgi:hypothetical protein